MELAVSRLWKNDIAITGTFSVDGQQKYFSLELPELFEGQPNVPQKCCIPVGTYPVVSLYSNHFERMMPHVQNVPGRSAIEIHYGNFPHDVLGCVLIGNKRISDTEIGDSRNAFEEFNQDFENAIAAGESVTLTVV
jgi:Family of unknown function (DUF5675)